MERTSIRQALAAIGLLLALVGRAGPAPGASFAIVDSEQGDPVGAGGHYVLTSPAGAFAGESFYRTADIDGRIHASGFKVEFTDAGDSWLFSFSAAPVDRDLLAGAYTVDPDQIGSPRLYVRHGQTDCVTPRGSFTVRDVAVAADGTLRTVNVEFEQRCDRDGPRLRGVLRFGVGDLACTGAPDGAPCDDTNACTTDDTCRAGSCVSGARVDCNDANGATDDACFIDRGCDNRTASSTWDVAGDLVVTASARGRTIRRRSTVEGTLVLRVDRSYEVPSGTCRGTGELLPSEVGTWRADRRGRLHLGRSNLRRVIRAVGRCLGAPPIRVVSYRHWVEIPAGGGTFCRWRPMPADGRHLCGYIRLHLTVVASGVTVEEDEVVRYAAERTDGGTFLPRVPLAMAGDSMRLPPRAPGGPLAAALGLALP
jgi:hypothetical protein